MPRAVRPAPSDAAPLMALLARGDLEALDAKRQQLMTAIELAKPRRSTILEGRLRQLTHDALKLRLAIARTMR